MDDECIKLAAKAIDLVTELGEEEEDAEEGFENFKAKKKAAEKAMTQGTAGQALQAAMVSLEVMMTVSKLKAQAVLARLQEITWLAKDAAALFKDMSDKRGRAAALATLTRAHLTRAQEPDAPMAALKSVKEAVAIHRELQDRKMEAEVLLLLGEAHLAKAAATPFENVMLEQINLSTKATKESEEIYRELDDRKGMANAMHCTARALLRHRDEDEVLEGERFADDAREVFHDLGDRASEVAVFLTGVAARQASSGPESSLMLAQDAAEDWQQEGGRPKDAALALLLAAGFQLELGELADSLRLAGEAQALYDRAGARRGVASALETRSAVLFAQKQLGDALNALEDMAGIFQKLGDKKSQGGALMMAANMLLHKLSEEVEADTQAEVDKKDSQSGISVDDVHKRSADGLEFAERARKCFEEAGDEEGVQTVTELCQSTYHKAIQIYCKSAEPDQIYYTLDKDSPLEDKSKCIREWKIPMPPTEGGDGGDGFLHVFDPHPPPSM